MLKGSFAFKINAKNIYFCISALIISFIFAPSAFAQSYSPFDFVHYLGNSRSAALAGAFVQMPDDPGAVFFNPATVQSVEKSDLSLTFIKHVSDINSGAAAYVMKDAWNGGSFAFSTAYTSYGDFDRANSQGIKAGTFSGGNFVFGGTYSNELDTNLFYGVTAKVIYMTLEQANSSAFAMDAGLLYKIPSQRVNVGVSILHAGSQMQTFDGTKESLPLDIRIGVNHRLRGLPLLVNFSFSRLADEESKFFDRFLNFAIGGEFYLTKSQTIVARLGYDNMIRRTSHKDNKSLTGFSGGVGINISPNMSVDYSISQWSIPAYLHRIGININLNKLGSK